MEKAQTKYIQWIVVAIVLLIVAVFLLNFFGTLFINEAIQDVVIQEKTEEVNEATLDKAAPYFELPDLLGNMVKVSQFQGAPLVLTFWTTWNDRAALQVKILDDLLLSDTNLMFKVLAVSSQENKSTVSSYFSRGGYTLPVVIDEKGAVGELYLARTLPVTYFIDAKGVIKSIVTGVMSKESLVDKSNAVFR